ncbi:MAG: lipid II flippase MurJ [Candidatus Paceibacterota bacterium]|jgi:putative peptidoglycan lipid II flippase
MVKRIISLLNKEFGGLHGAAFLLAASSLASQILALLRDRLLAGNLGPSHELDIYYAAFRVPDLLFATVGSFLSITVIIPVLISKLNVSTNETVGKENVSHFLGDMFSVFLSGMIFVGGLLFVLAPYFARIIIPGFDDESVARFIVATRILLLSPLFFGISSLLSGVTQSFKRFLVYALCPVLYNLGIILGVLIFYPIWGLNGLAYGVVLGAMMHLAVQIPTVLSVGVVPIISKKINWADVRYVVSRSLPRTLALGSAQIATMALVSLASLMASGSISIFNLSYNLQSIPLALIGISYSVAALPSMTDMFSRGKMNEFVDCVETAIRHIIFWSLPATALFIVLRAQIVRTVLGSGVFNWTNTRLTAAALAVFSVSILAQGLVNFLSMVYYSAGKTTRPVVTRIFSSVVVIVLAFGFSGFFVKVAGLRNFAESILRIEGVEGSSLLVLPLAFTIGSVLNALWLLYDFVRDFGWFSRGLVKSSLQSLLAAIMAGVASYQFLGFFASVTRIDTFWAVFAQGFFAGVFGLLVAVLVLGAFHNKELWTIVEVFKEKFWKSDTIVPTPEEL